MVGQGGSSAGSYLADPTSPIPSHCASIVATSTLRVKILFLVTAICDNIHYPVILVFPKGFRDGFFANNKLTLKVLVATIDAQWEGMGDVGSARYKPALLPPCPTIRVLSYSS